MSTVGNYTDAPFYIDMILCGFTVNCIYQSVLGPRIEGRGEGYNIYNIYNGLITTMLSDKLSMLLLSTKLYTI